MHIEVRDWLGELRRQYSDAFVVDSVLECGSYNVNGSVRDLFTAREYVGLDWRPGPAVDVVSLVHEYQPGRMFDTVISTEMLEHDPHWRESVAAYDRAGEAGRVADHHVCGSWAW